MIVSTCYLVKGNIGSTPTTDVQRKTRRTPRRKSQVRYYSLPRVYRTQEQYVHFNLKFKSNAIDHRTQLIIIILLYYMVRDWAIYNATVCTVLVHVIQTIVICVYNNIDLYRVDIINNLPFLSNQYMSAAAVITLQVGCIVI